MPFYKKLLQDAIEPLSEEEAHAILDLLQQFRRQQEAAYISRRLANDPTVKLPPAGFGPFPVVEPLEGIDPPASRQIIEDRR